jgi:Trk K+ transport system NAD-binding subunit
VNLINATKNKLRWWQDWKRDIQVFIHLFPWRVTLILLITLLMAAYLFWLAHKEWEGQVISPLKAIFAVINMTFFQLTFADMPADSRLDIFPVLVPLVGLPLFSIFGLKVIKVIRIFFLRGERGQEWQETLVRATIRDHIVICGLGRVGYRVAKQLVFDYGQPVVGIEETHSALVDELLAAGLPVILGNTESQEILKKAGIERAKAAIVCTNQDKANLGAAVLIRKLNPKARIALRLFEDELKDQIKAKFKLDAVISRSAVAATTFTYATIGGEIIETFKLADQEYVLARIPLGPTSFMLGRTIGEVADEQDVTVVCHHRAHKFTVDPSPDIRLAYGDTLFIFTTVAEMIDLVERGTKRHAASALNQKGPILVCGLGHTGYRVASNLLSLGCQVIALDSQPSRLSQRLAEAGVYLKFGDLRWNTLLLEAGISQATAIVVCTEDDMINLQIALRARLLNPNIRVVMRIFDTQLSEQLHQTLGVNIAIYSTSALAAPDFVAAALNRMNIRLVEVGGVNQAIARLRIKVSALNNLPLLALHREEDVTVLLHACNGQINIPPQLDTHLQVGDEIVVMASEEKLESLNQRNKTFDELATEEYN